MPRACVQLHGGNPIFNFDCGMGLPLNFSLNLKGGNSESLKMLDLKGTSGNEMTT